MCHFIGFGLVYNLLGIDMSHIYLFNRKDLIINILLSYRFAIYKCHVTLLDDIFQKKVGEVNLVKCKFVFENI